MGWWIQEAPSPGEQTKGRSRGWGWTAAAANPLPFSSPVQSVLHFTACRSKTEGLGTWLETDETHHKRRPDSHLNNSPATTRTWVLQVLPDTHSASAESVGVCL